MNNILNIRSLYKEIDSLISHERKERIQTHFDLFEENNGTQLLDSQDFYQKWQIKIKSNGSNGSNERDTELKYYDDIRPLLKCLSKTKNLSNLKFGDLLKAKENILKNKNELKDLANRAQGEVTIREAIQELTVWIENQQFDIIKMDDNNTNNTNNICLFKGWKDLPSIIIIKLIKRITIF